MTSEKIQIKLFTRGSVNTVDYVPVFQRWIREHVLGELLIDVVDYSHVFDGPEVALIGHEADYILDRTGGRLGLLYANKRASADGGNPFRAALDRATHACKLLESESGVPPITFDTRELQIRICDRLNAPNTDETFRRVEPLVREALTQAYGTAPVTFMRTGSPRDLFAIDARMH